MGRYNYCEIPTSGYFRLLEICPSQDSSEPIACHLSSHELGTLVKYEALSYTWGSERASYAILVNETQFLIRPNLYAFLTALRQHDVSRMVWVDAICIDQDDIAERNQQVLQMSEIYANAQVVNVWLGEGDASSDRGIVFLIDIHDRVYKHKDGPWSVVRTAFGTCKSPKADGDAFVKSLVQFEEFFRPMLPRLEPFTISDLNDAVKLLAKSWWKRMWTLQESVLCPNVICWCGSTTLPMRCFHTFAHFIYLSVNFNCWPASCVDTAVPVRSVWRSSDLTDHISQKGQISLTLALDSTWNRMASDPRDKVMGLLGLVGRRADLAPEYNWSLEKIYSTVMRLALAEDGNLQGLGLISENPKVRNPRLPSWVPDFEVHSSPGRDCITSLSKPIYTPHLYDASSRTSTRCCIDMKAPESVLALQGLLVDTVDAVGPAAPGMEFGHGEQDSGELWKNQMHSVLDAWYSLLPAAGTIYSTGESVEQAFWKTVLVDLKQGLTSNKLSATGPRRLDKGDVEWLSELGTWKGRERLISSWAAFREIGSRHLRLVEQFNRRFFVTNMGYFGLGHPELKTGDSVCILFGGAVAYTLRGCGDGSWIYIGEW